MVTTLQELNEIGWFLVFAAVVLAITAIVSGVKLWKDFKFSVGLKSVTELDKEQTKKDIKELQDNIKLLKCEFEQYKKDKDVQYHMYHQESIGIRDNITQSMTEITKILNEMKSDALDEKIDRMRWKILDFASQVRNGNISYPEQFNNVLKTYDEYEALLEKFGLSNGMVDESIKFIKEKYHDMLVGDR